MKYCPECGTKRVVNAKFCHECGFKFISISNEEVKDEINDEQVQDSITVETKEHNEPNFVLLDKVGKSEEQRRIEQSEQISSAVKVIKERMEGSKSYKAMVATEKVKASAKEFASDLANEKFEKGKEAAKEFVSKAADQVIDHVKEHGVEYAIKLGKIILTKKPK